MARRRFSANTVRSVGSLLPSDVLAKASAGEGLEGLEVDDFGFESDERLRDVVTDAWNEARGLWWQYQSQLRSLDEDDATATALTRERWLLPLLELLGFEDLDVARSAISVGDVEYPISHTWESSPLHLMGARVGLDERASGIAGAARLSPHSLTQQFLNRSDDHLWGIVSNGDRLRILRDSVSLTRQAYVEFDLEAMFNGEVFADFALLYKIAHATRFSGDRPEDCVLERWIAAARDEGIRALDQLRDGVESALTAFGTGFLRHSANSEIRDLVESGALDDRALYRYLLRLVYRLLFLFVAEDRDLLLVPEASADARERYDRFYSTGRLRELAERPIGSGHSDLWKGLAALFDVLGRDEGEPELGLPGLGSFLWAEDAIGPLIDGSLDNEVLLRAIRGLSYVQADGTARRIDFAGMGAEELGSVYESLLELHPTIDTDDRSFSLGGGAGSERKTTGSYYTPTELISELLDSALDPVVKRAMASDDPETAILDLKVVDPAAGSGHFLVAAAHRIGKRLAEVRTGEPEPPNEAYRTAVRDVVSRCLFAVDINELAVELCKVSLWLEALEPGKPLSFLDHHILHGNSLFGATPAAIAGGIPDEAYVALTADDKRTVAALKKRNKKERFGQDGFVFDDAETAVLGSEIFALEGFDDTDLSTVKAKERLLDDWKASDAYRHARLVADAWCGAFAIEKTANAPALTEAVFRRLRNDGILDNELRGEIESLQHQFAFFHWHLGFPQVFRTPGQLPQDGPGWSGGFDVVLGNPPWEKLKIQEREWFRSRIPRIADASTKAERTRLIEGLSAASDGSKEARIYAEWLVALREQAAVSHFVRRSGIFPLGGVGDVNVYAVFADLIRQIISTTGRVGFLSPVGLAIGATYAPFFRFLVSTGRLVSFYSFENEELLFPAVHHETKFALVTLSGSGESDRKIVFTGYIRRAASIRDGRRRYELSSTQIEAMNPNTSTAPLFRWSIDAQITAGLHDRAPVLRRREPVSDPWCVDYVRLFDMTNDSDLFHIGQESPGKGFLRLYEGKMVWLYDHRYGTYEGQTEAQSNQRVLPRVSRELKRDPNYTIRPRYWVQEDLVTERLDKRTTRRWLLGFRDTGPSERTLVPSVIPRTAVGNKLPLLLPDQPADTVCFLIAQLSSFVVDYCLRNKTSGSVNLFIVEQLPIFSPKVAQRKSPWHGGRVLDFFVPRVVELVATAADVAAFPDECGFDVSTFPWEENRRAVLKAELDAAVFHLFGLGRDSVDHIMETFTVSRKYDEAQYGTYRTKELILDVYDRMTKSIETGEPYQTSLDPPPADSSLRVGVEGLS